MKIIVALDSFKGSLDAVPACEAVRRGILSELPFAEVVCKPMADGGEGTAAVLMASEKGKWIPCRVTGPLFDMQVDAGFVWFAETREALVEMAVASGLPLLEPHQQNPLQTTTYGTGELIRAAIDKGAEKIRLAVGGSATVDGGMGAAEALGYRFLDADGNELHGTGSDLSRIRRIELNESLGFPEVEVLCDVTNPLTGTNGAAAVYGPQKGATPEMVRELDRGLHNLAVKISEYSGEKVEFLSGAGAAGGLSAGAVAFMDAQLVPGVDSVLAAHRMEEELREADWVITGEGRLDHQSLQGKVVDGVCRLAAETKTQVAVLAGSVELMPDELAKAGIANALSLKSPGMKLQDAIERAENLLECRAAELTRSFR